MTKMKILPKAIVAGELKVPSSKSYGQRAIALASLSQKEVVLKALTNSDDVIAAQGVIKSLGAQFIRRNDELHLLRGIDLQNKNSISINCNESGLSTRLFSAFSLLFDQEFQLNGEGSITLRTMEMVIDGLKEFGKEIQSNQTKLPLIVEGKISQFEVEIDGSISSQFLTGLLVVAPFLIKDTKIKVHNLKSKPYIEMTIDLMRQFGLEVKNKDFEEFSIKGQQKIEDSIEYKVEGDWSAASFHIVAAAIGGKMKLTGLIKDSQQGDKEILNAIQEAGAKVSWDDGSLIVEKSKLLPFDFDATECPDLFPPLVVLAAFTNGISHIKGLKRLKHKESDRGVTLQRECAKIGLKIDLGDDEMIIHGKGQASFTDEVIFSSHNDHRIAMAMTLFSIGAKHSIFIENPEAIDKSYPNFYTDFLTI